MGAVFAMHSFQWQVHHIFVGTGDDLIAGSHGGTQNRVGGIQGNQYLKNLGPGASKLLANIGHIRNIPGVLYSRKGIYSNLYRLTSLYFADVYLVDISLRDHAGQIRQSGYREIPGTDGGSGGSFLPVPAPLVDDHTIAGSPYGEFLEHLFHLVLAALLLGQVDGYFVHLCPGLLYLQLIIFPGLPQLTPGPLKLNIGLTLGGRRLILGLLNLDLILLNPILQINQLIPEFLELH